MRADQPAAPDDLLAALPAGARRLVLVGQPPPAPGPATPAPGGGGGTVHRPKDIPLELLRAALPQAAGGPEGMPEILAGNPHFLRISEWSPDLAVLHGAALELVCPVPRARNLVLLDGADLLTLAEERRSGDPLALSRQRIALMDGALVLDGAAPVPSDDLVPVPRRGFPLPEVLAAGRGRLPRGHAGGPVQWCGCDLETGPYNFLARHRRPVLGTSHVPVLLRGAARRAGGRPGLIAFATPGMLPELGPALRACAALPARGAPLLEVFVFGTPEELVAALERGAPASLFGDNLRSPNIRFLFAPFAAADLLEAVAGAAGSVDTCHGGVLDALARGLGLANRLVLGPDGGFDAWRGGEAVARGVAWDAIHAPAMLARRRHKADRSQERRLLALLAEML